MARRLSVKHRRTARDIATARKKAGGRGRKKHKVANDRSRKAKLKNAYRQR